MIAVRYDTQARTLTIDASEVRPWGADVGAVMERHGQRVALAGVSFGATVTVGAESHAFSWPHDGESFESTDQDLLVSTRVRWEPDDVVEVAAWIDSPLGRVEASETFTAPRPPQPYPSWAWIAGQWTPPVPAPDDGLEYDWNEALQQWALV